MAESRASGGRVKLNVGGSAFESSLLTLTRFDNSMFSAMLADRWQRQEELFIDRNPAHFAKVLDYLRDGEYVVLPEDRNSLRDLRREADFYNLPGLVDICSSKLEEYEHPNHGELLKINVGGVIFETSLSTVTRAKNSVLFALVADSRQEHVFIDRDPTHFAKVLDYLRDGERFVPPSNDDTRDSLRNEAEFYNLPGLANLCACDVGDKVKWTKKAIDRCYMLRCENEEFCYYSGYRNNCMVCESELYGEDEGIPRYFGMEMSEVTDSEGWFALSDFITPSSFVSEPHIGYVMEVNSTCCLVHWQHKCGEYEIHAPKSLLRLANYV
ncbi:unnamed protein product [Cylicocyclus nassatus]|uniref:BTB domain-containing protein n=1 Tax=Cylicocyclus nassatus TaxID=53992 RepID=A0AA36DQT0_CYLNA|nr:unnamed protein product [Cylicocyclus nassatus]